MEDDRVQNQEAPSSDEEILDLAKSRFITAHDGWSRNHQRMLDDVNFRNGEQWEERVKQAREAENKPCLTINLSEMILDQIVGDQRQNKPSIKVRPVDGPILELDGSAAKIPNINGNNDYEYADVVTGIIRNIEYCSSSDNAYDTAFDHVAGHGLGYWRICTQYSDDDTFEQDIRIKRIKNPFAVLIDPSFEDSVAADAMYAFISKWVPRKEHEKAYGHTATLDIGEGVGEQYEHWYTEDKVRQAEYFYKEPVKEVVVQIHTGEVFKLGKVGSNRVKKFKYFLQADGAQIVKERIVKTHRVMRSLINGSHVLEKPKEFPCKFIPIIPVLGKELNVKGESIYRGAIRHYKDSQRMLNYWESSAAETVVLQSKAPYVGTVKQFEGYEDKWRTANTSNHAYLPYNPDEKAPGAPKRELPPQPDMGSIERAKSAYEHILNTTSINRSSLGQMAGEKSGKAILARQREGDTATFAYTDNLAKSLEHTARCLIDMIPRVYDTERVMRIRQVDGKEDFVRINKQMPDGSKLYDLSKGKYDVVVTVGPSYTTQRQEAAEAMLEFLRVVPEARPALMDMVTAAMDWPEADEAARRLRKLVPPQLMAKDNDGDGQPDPIPPTPQEQAEQLEAQAKIMKAQADIMQAKADMMEAGATTGALNQMVMQKVAELFSQLGIAAPQQQSPMMPQQQQAIAV